MNNLFALLMLLSLVSFSKTTSVKSGRWGDVSTWSNGKVPMANDTVFISPEHQVSLSQALNECKRLEVQGRLCFKSSNRKLKTQLILLKAAGELSSQELGTVETDTLLVQGLNVMEGFNVHAKLYCEIAGELKFKRSSGLINLQKVKLLSTGVWDVVDDRSFIINESLENNGRIVSGKGMYSFKGTVMIKGESKTSLGNISFTDTIVNEAHLEIRSKATAINDAVLVNEKGATLELKTTPTNFKVGNLDLHASGNNLLLSRGTKQKMPKSKGEEYGNVILKGQLDLDRQIFVKGSFLLDSLSHLQILGKGSFTGGGGAFELKYGTKLSIINTDDFEFSELFKSFNTFNISPKSTIEIIANKDHSLPSVAYGSLILKTNDSIRVSCSGAVEIKGDFFLSKNTMLDLNGNQVVFKGECRGQGKLEAHGTTVLYNGEKGQGIFPANYDTLEINNTGLDTCTAFGKFSVACFKVIKGKLKIGSLSVLNLLIEPEAEVIVGGVQLIVHEELLNRGSFSVVSDYADCKFVGKILNYGVFQNGSSSDHFIGGDVLNDGFFSSCNTSGCTWSVGGNIKVSGKNELTFSRLNFVNTDTVFNDGVLEIEHSIKGNGTIVNLPSSQLSLGMNSVLNEANIQAKAQENTVVFNKLGNQSICDWQCHSFYHLSIKGKGKKEVALTATLKGDLMVDTGATLDVNSKSLSVDVNSKVILKPRAKMILGNSLSDFPTAFPPYCQRKNITIDPTATISYESKGDQEISSTPIYGHLQLKDGATIESSKSLTKDHELLVKGNLSIEESSINFELNNTIAEVYGELNGPGTLQLDSCKVTLYGNADLTGPLKGKGFTFKYAGGTDQRIKNAQYPFLEIDKTAGIASINAGPGTFVVTESMHIKQGEVKVGGEYFETQGALVVDGKLTFISRVQQKIINRLEINNGAILDNSYGVNISCKGNVSNEGEWFNGKGSSVVFNEHIEQKFWNKGRAYFSKFKINKGTQQLVIQGNVVVKDFMNLVSGHVKLQEAIIEFKEKAMMTGERERHQIKGDEKSKLFANVNLKDTVNNNVAGLGLSVFSDSILGQAILTRTFSRVLLPEKGRSIAKAYRLQTTTPKQVNTRYEIQYFKHELEGLLEDSIHVYESIQNDNNLPMTFSLVNSVLDSIKKKVLVPKVLIGQTYTLGKVDLSTLPVKVIDFSGRQLSEDLVQLEWSVAHETFGNSYELSFSENGYDFFHIEAEILKVKDQPLVVYRSLHSIGHLSSNKVLYYKLYEIDPYGVKYDLKTCGVKLSELSSMIRINGSQRATIDYGQNATFFLYDLKGKLIEKSLSPNFYKVIKKGMYLLVIVDDGRKNGQKLYVN